MPRIQKRRRAAFTLIEVMISLFIVAAGAMMFYALMPMAFKTGKMVGNYQQASSLVQHKIDQLRGVGYGRLTFTELRNAGIIDASPTSAPFQFKTIDGLSTIYPNATATVDVVDFDANTKRVTVTLTWTGSANRQGNGSMSAQALIVRS